MKVLIAGGGTGGHIYPALAIIRGIKGVYPEAEFLYVGTEKGLEARIVPKEGLPFKTITVEGLPRKIGLSLAGSILKMTQGFIQSGSILKEFAPDIVIGTGGYVCGPIVLAAAIRKIPTLIHEQNAFPGITNKLLARIASRVAVTFPESVKYFKKKDKVVVTGLPVRPEILEAKQDSAEDLGFKREGLNILVVGGSRGARNLNLAVDKLITHYGGREDISILIVTGEVGYDEFLKFLSGKGIEVSTYRNIMLKPYLHRMADALAAANLVICRAGATTIAELTVRGLPSVLIPYPYAAENHQEYNARALADQGAAILIKDAELTGDKLLKVVDGLLNSQEQLKKMGHQAYRLGKPDALQKIIKIVQDLVV